CASSPTPASCPASPSRAGKGRRADMSMTDPIADMLTRLRNRNAAHHDEVIMPSSRIKVEIAKVLKQEGYIWDFAVAKADVGSQLTIVLKYGPHRERTISGGRRISTPRPR